MKSDKIIHISTTDSTNSGLGQLNTEVVLKEGVGLPEGTILWADFQSAGKGQRGNSWESENSKNLTFSIILHPSTIKANQQFLISQVVALGVAKFLNKYTDNISIKWPNDIYCGNRKICGILIENQLEDTTMTDSIAGIGININQTIFISNAPNPVSLKLITGNNYSLDILIEEVQLSILSYYKKLLDGEIDAIKKEYKNNLFRKDGFHLFNDGITDFYAKIKDIEETGTLVLEDKNGMERDFAFKEVKFIL